MCGCASVLVLVGKKRVAYVSLCGVCVCVCACVCVQDVQKAWKDLRAKKEINNARWEALVKTVSIREGQVCVCVCVCVCVYAHPDTMSTRTAAPSQVAAEP